MRLPRLGGYQPAIAYRLLVHKPGAGLFGFQPNVFVTGHPLVPRESRRRDNLHTVTDGKDPLTLTVELANDLEQPGIVSQVLRRSAAEDEDRGVILDFDVLECDGCLETISAAFDVGVPSRLEIVHHEV